MLMLRRTFLLSTSIAAFAAVLPTSVFATPAPYVHVDSGAPIAKLELIEQALDAAHKLGFRMTQKVRLFGFEPVSFVRYSTYDLRDTLYEHVIDYGNIDVWNRMRYTIAIYERVVRDFPHIDPAGFLDYPSHNSGGYTLRQQALLDQMALRHVALELGCGEVSHGFAEMRAFG